MSEFYFGCYSLDNRYINDETKCIHSQSMRRDLEATFLSTSIWVISVSSVIDVSATILPIVHTNINEELLIFQDSSKLSFLMQETC